MEKITQKEKRDESVRKILVAAMEVFAEVGFSGARMDEIAKKAGINKAMIYYRIGDKKTLHTQVLHYVFGDTAMEIAEKIAGSRSPEEKLRIYLRDVLSIVERNPFIPRIMMWEFASGGLNVPEVFVQDLGQLIQILIEILGEGVENGTFIKTNPLLPHLMAVGALVFYRVSEPIRGKNKTKQMEFMISDKDSGKKALSDIVELVLRALKK
ncbi:MAG: TetR/AcrR family transcriptional regulator [Deltaproteobacteria bacterium]|nr:TetR/AcrR family transcriptional regulator [Deltaproteobacteria bacterium]